jgi:hypothetical protein
MVWLLAEIAARIGTWLVKVFRHDMENDEWEHGARLPPWPFSDSDDPPDAPEKEAHLRQTS